MTEPIHALHVGDLHFWRVAANPLRLLGKRLLGLGNLLVRRARAFPPAAPPDLMRRLATGEDARWALFSGDFTTTSLPGEFAAARRALDPVMQRFREGFIAVPGNHDRYTRSELRRHSFEACFPHAGFNDGLMLAELAPGHALVAIDATTSNGLGSFGRLRRDHAKCLKTWRRGAGAAIRSAFVLCHFPALDPPGLLKPSRRGELRDAPLLLELLDEWKVPTAFLHGHHHRRWLYRDGARPWLLHVNAGAPTMRRGRREPDLGYYRLSVVPGELPAVVEVSRSAGEWRERAIALPEPGRVTLLQD